MIHKILLVDDDQMIAEDFQRTIAGESDLELTWASSGAKAISEVQKNPRGFSVIVMDYLMPDMSGAEINERTYNEYQTSDPIFFSIYFLFFFFSCLCSGTSQ